MLYGVLRTASRYWLVFILNMTTCDELVKGCEFCLKGGVDGSKIYEYCPTCKAQAQTAEKLLNEELKERNNWLDYIVNTDFEIGAVAHEEEMIEHIKSELKKLKESGLI